MVMRESLTLVMIGLTAGLGAALAATRVVASQLYGLKPHDPVTVAVGMCLLLAVAAFASFVPARRASQVDPMAALRYE
jgi:ABC-type antimicrobial peptide transport system permease subunit